MSSYVAAIDQGTASTRFTVFDHEANVIAVDEREHRQVSPRPGWVEMDPREILAHTREVVRVALARGGLSPADLAAVGIANQRESVVVWDHRTGEPIANAIG